MVDSILFDLDGTLWDSTDIVATAWNKAIAEDKRLHLTFTGDDLKKLFGKPLPEIASIIFGELPRKDQLELMDRCCHEEHTALLKTCGTLFPKLEATLKELSTKYKLCIVSNCEDGYIETFLKASGLTEYFTDFECPGNSGLLKGDNIKLVVERNHFKQPVYLGDTQGDADACAYAKVPFIHASYGFGTVSNSKYKISAFSELPSYIEKTWA